MHAGGEGLRLGTDIKSSRAIVSNEGRRDDTNPCFEFDFGRTLGLIRRYPWCWV